MPLLSGRLQVKLKLLLFSVSFRVQLSSQADRVLAVRLDALLYQAIPDVDSSKFFNKLISVFNFPPCSVGLVFEFLNSFSD